jgi:hypothetical protein
MTLVFLTPPAAGNAAAGITNRLAGTGAAFFAPELRRQIVSSVQTILIGVILCMINGLQRLWSVHPQDPEHPQRIAHPVNPAIFSIPQRVPARTTQGTWPLKLVIAGFVILYRRLFRLRRSLSKLARPTPFADGVAVVWRGFPGGFKPRTLQVLPCHQVVVPGLAGVFPTPKGACRQKAPSQIAAALMFVSGLIPLLREIH